MGHDRRGLGHVVMLFFIFFSLSEDASRGAGLCSEAVSGLMALSAGFSAGGTGVGFLRLEFLTALVV